MKYKKPTQGMDFSWTWTKAPRRGTKPQRHHMGVLTLSPPPTPKGGPYFEPVSILMKIDALENIGWFANMISRRCRPKKGWKAVEENMYSLGAK